LFCNERIPVEGEIDLVLSGKMEVEVTGEEKDSGDNEGNEKGNLGLESDSGKPLIDQGPSPLKGKRGGGCRFVWNHLYSEEGDTYTVALFRSIIFTRITPISKRRYMGTPIKLMLNTSGVGVTMAAVTAMSRIAYFRFRVKKAALTNRR